MRVLRRSLILALAAASLLGVAASYALLAMSIDVDPGPGTAVPVILDLAFFLAIGIGLPAFAVVGVLLVWRRDHPMGWVFGAVGAGLGIGFATGNYVFAAEHGIVVSVPMVAWLSNWLLVPSLAGGVVALLLLFPTGNLPTPRWRPLAWLAAADLAAWILALMLHPLLLDAGRIRNPFPVTLPLDVAEWMEWIASMLFGGALIAGVLAIVRRFRAARGPERQQLKWFTYAAAVTAVGFGCLFVADLSPELEPIGNIGWPVGIFGLSAIPVAAGIAILRYRLYDIDVIIRRTLVYGALSLTLGLVYAGSVIALQGLLSGFAGSSSLAVAASTLAVAALFQPARRRIQRAVESRFYRARYDADRTLEAFSARLRDEVDLARLTDELHAVVIDTLQPASASVWLRQRDS